MTLCNVWTFFLLGYSYLRIGFDDDFLCAFDVPRGYFDFAMVYDFNLLTFVAWFTITIL